MEAAPVDLAHLRSYTEADPALEAELAALFQTSGADYLERLAAAADPAEWREAAHALKGAARSLGANLLGALAEQAERADEPARRPLLDALRAEFQRTCAFLRQLQP